MYPSCSAYSLPKAKAVPGAVRKFERPAPAGRPPPPVYIYSHR
jgi:hypothetical protein